MPNGDLVVAGRFTTIGGASIADLARWNGSAWQGIAAGSSQLDPQCLLALPNGDLVVGGSPVDRRRCRGEHRAVGWQCVARAGRRRRSGTARIADDKQRRPARRRLVHDRRRHRTGGLARRDGTNWHVDDPSVVGVSALVHDNFSVLHVAAQSQVLRIVAGITTTVASFDGPVRAIAFDGNGELLVGGDFQSLIAPQGVIARNLARRSGASWSAMPGPAPDPIHGFVRLPSGQLAVLGLFMDGTGRSNGLLGWDGAAWNVFGRGLDGPVSDILVEANGDAIVGGWFRFAAGVDVGGLARWDGQALAPLGGGTNGLVAALARAPNGDVLVGGSFTAIGGVAANCIARWDGASWTALPGLGASPSAYIESIVVLPSGELVVGGKRSRRAAPACPRTVWCWPRTASSRCRCRSARCRPLRCQAATDCCCPTGARSWCRPPAARVAAGSAAAATARSSLRRGIFMATRASCGWRGFLISSGSCSRTTQRVAACRAAGHLEGPGGHCEATGAARRADHAPGEATANPLAAAAARMRSSYVTSTVRSFPSCNAVATWMASRLRSGIASRPAARPRTASSIAT